MARGYCDPMSECRTVGLATRSSLARCWRCCTALLTCFKPSTRPTAPGATYSAYTRRFRAHTEEHKRRGASIASVSAVRVASPRPLRPKRPCASGAPASALRQELHGGRQDGYYSVADGPLWWSWTNTVAPSATKTSHRPQRLGQQLQSCSTPYRCSVRCAFGGRQLPSCGQSHPHRSRHPPPYDPRRSVLHRGVHELGIGAKHYQLEVDQERGVLPAVTALRDEQPLPQDHHARDPL